MLLHIPFVDLGARGETCAQGVTREQGEPFFFGQFRAQACGQYGLFDQAGNVPIVQPGVEGALAISRRAQKNRAKIDLGIVQP